MTYKLLQEHLRISPLSLAELNGDYVSWMNDREVCRYTCHGEEEYTLAQAREFINSLCKDSSRQVYAIYTIADSRHIGNISLQQISYKNRNAELAILMGAKSEWGKGYATEAVKMLLQIGFEKLGLRRIYGGVRKDNIGMRRVFEKADFQQEGILKENVYKNGKFHDVVVYGILSNNI